MTPQNVHNTHSYDGRSLVKNHFEDSSAIRKLKKSFFDQTMIQQLRKIIIQHRPTN